jgi:hypothetical protein
MHLHVLASSLLIKAAYTFSFPANNLLRGVHSLKSSSKFYENPEHEDVFRDIPNRRLNKIFSEISSGGSFAVGGIASFPCLPGLKIEGVGDISFPLIPFQADLIKETGTQAPYGKGSETIVDKTVRNTIQLSPSLVQFSPRWPSMLDDLARTACAGMGIDKDTFRTELY